MSRNNCKSKNYLYNLYPLQYLFMQQCHNNSVYKKQTCISTGPNRHLFVSQISPPNEHIVLGSPWRPWWQRYQPISYNLCSRSGSESELRDMITRCNNVGVKKPLGHSSCYHLYTKVILIKICQKPFLQVNIYVDAVINHMCGAGGGEGTHSSCGSWFNAGTKDFPSVPYSNLDFNDYKCRTSSGNIENYSDKYQVMCHYLHRVHLNTFTAVIKTIKHTSIHGSRCVTVVWSVCWIWLWRRTLFGTRWPTSWTNWSTWAWPDSGWMPSSTCGLETSTLSLVVCITWTLSGSPMTPNPSSSKRCFKKKSDFKE